MEWNHPNEPSNKNDHLGEELIHATHPQLDAPWLGLVKHTPLDDQLVRNCTRAWHRTITEAQNAFTVGTSSSDVQGTGTNAAISDNYKAAYYNGEIRESGRPEG